MDTTATNQDSNSVEVTPWDDPALPPGTAPPQPKWRLIASIAAYVVWIAVLITMVVLRMRDTPV